VETGVLSGVPGYEIAGDITLDRGDSMKILITCITYLDTMIDMCLPFARDVRRAICRLHVIPFAIVWGRYSLQHTIAEKGG